MFRPLKKKRKGKKILTFGTSLEKENFVIEHRKLKELAKIERPYRNMIETHAAAARKTENLQ